MATRAAIDENRCDGQSDRVRGRQADMTDTGASQLTIGFVGLGNMGWPMARNLHNAGLSLVVRDIATQLQERFAAEHPGVTAAESPAAFSGADIVVTMLPNGAVVQDALLNWDDGIGRAMRAGALVVEMSSSDPSDTLRLAAELERSGLRVVDAPVSGGVPAAVTGELAIMAGGAPEDLARAQVVLQVLGDPARQFATGGLGTGHAMKSLNNFIAAATHCATAEALVAGKMFGLDPAAMIDIINASTGRSFVSRTFSGEVLTGRYGTGFALGLLAKDVHIAASVAAAAGIDAPAVTLTDERWAKALSELGPAADHTKAHQAWWAEPLTPNA
jgi:3-hydroxyisobutyrate dehydrogenase